MAPIEQLPRLKVVQPDDGAPAWREWEGGRYRTSPNGRTYYIRRSVPGYKRFEFSLGDVSPSEALAEWSRFEEAVKAGNPYDYRPPQKRTAAKLNKQATGAVRLDTPTYEAFLRWALQQVDAGALTDSYVKHTLGLYLAWWLGELNNRDLHTVTLGELQGILAGAETAEHKRVVALKAFTRWARKDKAEPKLRRAQDPTLDLVTPPVTPEKARRKKGYATTVVEALYRALPTQATRDMIRLRVGAHGLHDTEIDRLARGNGELRVVNDKSGIFGVLVFPHKRGTDHVVPVDEATFRAAERMRARGRAVSKTAMLWALKTVAIKQHGCGGVKKAYGRRTGDRAHDNQYRAHPCPQCPRYVMSELRHSFATWARTLGQVVKPTRTGVSAETIAEAMGHTSATTSKMFYIGDHVPDMIRIPITLEHPDDP